MSDLRIERLDSGFVVRQSEGLGDSSCAYTEWIDVLRDVYHFINSDWHVGDRVQIVRDGKVLKEPKL